MPAISYDLIVLLAILQSSFTQRRIKNGFVVQTDKKYMVYLLKAPSSYVHYKGWTCGGAIVSSQFVVTSAACLEDVQQMYVISGYRRYVPSTELENDECTKKMKKKVILICLPKDYNFDHKKTESWARIDIAVVKVDSPFDFNDHAYILYCSYIPKPIEINFEVKLQAPGRDVIALGWGHAESYRKDKDETNYNQDTLHYAPTRILEKEICLQYYENTENILPVIANYMICTLESGNIDDKGDIIIKSPRNLNGCISKMESLFGVAGRTCAEDYSEIIALRTGKGDIAEVARPQKVIEETRDEAMALGRSFKQIASRTPGICQNDHGGPLVTWMGAHEVLIGVATLYKLDDHGNCRGPFLFTSTQCNSAFLNCVLTMDNSTETRRQCQKAEEKGVKLIQRRVSWFSHRESPAENEKIHERHQVPINAFG